MRRVWYHTKFVHISIFILYSYMNHLSIEKDLCMHAHRCDFVLSSMILFPFASTLTIHIIMAYNWQSIVFITADGWHMLFPRDLSCMLVLPDSPGLTIWDPCCQVSSIFVEFRESHTNWHTMKPSDFVHGKSHTWNKYRSADECKGIHASIHIK
jgi:hypothetical protein